MSTLGQVLANRENARKSTGPKSAEGKATVAHNPLVHGLRATKIILPDEDAAEFAAFRSGMFAEFGPKCSEETMLVERFVSLCWRRRRCERAETAILNRAYAAAPAGQAGESGDGAPLADAFIVYHKELANLTRYTNQIVREMAQVRKALEDFKERWMANFKEELALVRRESDLAEREQLLQKREAGEVVDGQVIAAVQAEQMAWFRERAKELGEAASAYEEPELAWSS